MRRCLKSYRTAPGVPGAPEAADAASTPAPAGNTEPPVVDASKLMTPLQEMASRMGKKAAKLAGSLNEKEKASDTSGGTPSDTDRKAA